MTDHDSSRTDSEGVGDRFEYENDQLKFKEEEANVRIHVDEVATTVRKRVRDGSLAFLGGALMLLRVARTTGKNRSRAAMQALTGLILIEIGRRQRRSNGDKVGETVTDKATANPVSEGRQPEINVDEMVEDEPKTDEDK